MASRLSTFENMRTYGDHRPPFVLSRAALKLSDIPKPGPLAGAENDGEFAEEMSPAQKKRRWKATHS